MTRFVSPARETATAAPRHDAARVATGIRLRALRMVAPQGFGYLGQALCSAESLAVLYAELFRPGVDRFVCSPGHYIVAAYAVAAEVGLLDPEELSSYGQNGSCLEAIGTERSPAVDLTCGSLAQGLSGGVGFACSDRLRGRAEGPDAPRTFVLCSDGELEEGQLWEAALFAAHHRLGRLVVLLDANNSQVDGPVDGITTLEPIAEKWAAHGWHVADVDGHDLDALRRAYADALSDDRPSVIVARTSTRHGLDCLPPDADGHFIKLPPDLANRAFAELETRYA
ncbi:1-deoxy-D-xylulose-5-phosphate synthase N-terminal domain-containing protein [Amycolatopsis ultiminotia]|uniref:1-deoxy-D-xylulose-5-phosphate synthase N-terminal domain-containing protein n=1 Tax=Amycolatopsis ultiminotia TaxID=543629 RepID=A0ABP6V5J7_9PSEU